MRYKELTLQDKRDFLDIFNQVDKSKKKIINELTNKFNIHKRTVYTFHEKITAELYDTTGTISLDDIEIEKVTPLRDVSDYTSEDIELILKENKKLRNSITLQRDNNNLLRKEGREDTRASSIYESIKNIVRVYTPKKHSINVIKRDKKSKSKNKPFILLSDVHYNEIIQGKYIEDNNEFNNEICLHGIEKVFQEAAKMDGDTLRVYLAGDLIAGLIHGLDARGQVPVTQSVIELASYLAELINTYAEYYKEINVLMVNGNHSRIKEKPAIHLKAFDFEHLLYELMKKDIVAKNVTTRYSYSAHLVDNVGTAEKPVYNLVFHGDMKSFNPTMDSTILKQFNIGDELFDIRVTHTMSGHTHRPVFATNFRGGVSFVNGCISGSSEFGYNCNFLPLHPFQWVGSFSECGKEVTNMKCVKIR